MWGFQVLGVPVAGPMVPMSPRLANALVGNRRDAALLEVTLLGPELEFTSDATVAVTGAELPPKVDGQPRATWTSFKVRKGQRLTFDFLKAGARAYIAISGGVDVPVVLGSRSTYTLGALGGYQGRKLAAGDELPLDSGGEFAEGRMVPLRLRRAPSSPAELRMMPGLYWHRITELAGQHFFEDTWKVAPEADRIGYRFRGGRPLDFVPRDPPFGSGSDPSNIFDAGCPYGSVQVPSGTEPIILHRDAVSGGGYFMIGTIISADMDLIGQLQPNATARFTSVTMEQALAARHDREKLLNEVREGL